MGRTPKGRKRKWSKLMEMLGLKETLDRLSKANGLRWYGHVIRRDDDNTVKPRFLNASVLDQIGFRTINSNSDFEHKFGSRPNQ